MKTIVSEVQCYVAWEKFTNIFKEHSAYVQLSTMKIGVASFFVMSVKCLTTWHQNTYDSNPLNIEVTNRRQ